ncbi:MAG: hypothetical protein U1F76_17915 [Candidatus Competibacteraceae bacterium]
MIGRRQLDTIVRLVEEQGLHSAMIARLRGLYPGLHFTHCLDEEINAIAPVEERPGFNVYLVDSREHCPRLTDDFDSADGLALAEVVE